MTTGTSTTDAASTGKIHFEDGAIQVDATIVAKGLGVLPAQLLERLRGGKITSLCERGIDADIGRYRLTFFAERRRFRIVIDADGSVLQRSSIDFGAPPLAAPARRVGG